MALLPPWSRVFAAWLLAAALMVTAVGSATAAGIDWQPCEGAARFECATLAVPLDYTDPAGPQIELALIMHPASDPAARVGTLMFNPGGPGGAGTADLPSFYSYFAPQIRARFDIVSFDPRGIGASDQLRCFASVAQENALLAQLPAAGFPIGPGEVQQEISVFARFDQTCAENGGPILFHMDTTDVARDMDLIRAALGDPKLDYYGPSYGSYLGATYANLFPTHVGRIVLDGDVPPVEWNDAQAGATVNTFVRIGSPLGSETALRLMLDDCGSVDTTHCAFSAGTPAATEAKYEALAASLQVAPVTAGGQMYTYPLLIDADQSDLLTQNAGAFGPGWAALAELLQSLWIAATSPSDAAQTPLLAPSPLPSEPVADSADHHFPPDLPEGAYGVLCSDSPNPPNPDSYQAQAQLANATQAPDGFGYDWTWTAEPCAQWQARDSDRYTGPWNRSPVPLLVIGTQGDPNTPYASAVRMASELGNARLLTETGGGHTALLNPSDCVDTVVSNYLIDGTLPPPGTVCSQNQQPF